MIALLLAEYKTFPFNCREWGGTGVLTRRRPLTMCRNMRDVRMERHTWTVDPLRHLERRVPLLVPPHVGRTLAHFRLCKQRYGKGK